MNRLRILLPLFWVCPFSYGLSYDLEVGASLSLDERESSDIQVSRRGVVEIEHVESHGGREKWRLTGLRKGLVVLRFFDSSGKIFQRHYVRVGGEEKKKPTRIWKVNKFCKQLRLSCDTDTGVVNGQVKSLTNLLALRRECRKKCILDIQVTPQVDTQWRAFLRRQFDGRITGYVTEGGIPVVLSHCSIGKVRHVIDERLNHMLREKIVICDRQFERQWQAVLYLTASDDGTKKTRKDAPRSIDQEITIWGRELTPKREDVMARHQANASVILQDGAKTVLAGLSRYKNDGQSRFRAELEVSAIDKLKVVVTYDVKLFHGNGHAQSLQSKRFVTTYTPTYLGHVIVGTSRSQEGIDEILGHIPIIGPFFRDSRSVASRTRIEVWIKLTPMEEL